MTSKYGVWWKSQILANGICIDESVINNYDLSFLEKRCAYGIQDPEEYKSIRIPQEMFILPEEIVCAININTKSEYVLYYHTENKAYYVKNKSNQIMVGFPKRPKFYEKSLLLNNQIKVNQVLTLYGGHSLGAFLIRNCWMEEHGVCHFCSLCNNHSKQNDFLNIIGDNVLEDSIRIALEDDYPITQIMLNGGNLSNLDDNFKFYANKVIKIRNLLDKLKKTDIELHLIVSPPKDLQLIEMLKSQKIKIAMNMETYDNELFSKFCPGKQKYIGHEHIFHSLKKSVDILGEENVYSIFVGGLESLHSLKCGLEVMKYNGIVPVVNILHIDPNTLIQENQRPSSDYIFTLGKILQNIYSTYSSSFTPFYYNCGRNSIDSEAYNSLFF